MERLHPYIGGFTTRFVRYSIKRLKYNFHRLSL